jgi:hypothetical protein
MAAARRPRSPRPVPQPGMGSEGASSPTLSATVPAATRGRRMSITLSAALLRATTVAPREPSRLRTCSIARRQRGLIVTCPKRRLAPVLSHPPASELSRSPRDKRGDRGVSPCGVRPAQQADLTTQPRARSVSRGKLSFSLCLSPVACQWVRDRAPPAAQSMMAMSTCFARGGVRSGCKPDAGGCAFCCPVRVPCSWYQ